MMSVQDLDICHIVEVEIIIRVLSGLGGALLLKKEIIKRGRGR